MTIGKPFSLLSKSAEPSLLKPGISELVIPSWEQASFELILPMLAHLSHQATDRWLTWIGKSSLPKSALSHHSFNARNLRMIKSHNDEETLPMMWHTLRNKTSAFVVASFEGPNTVTAKERKMLEAACFEGYSRALIVKFPGAVETY